ncbi:MAG: M28 family peptidase [Bryobacteraceae bacterium]
MLGEISAENAMSQTRALASRPRYPNSMGFFGAAEYVSAQARAYGLENVRIERFERRQPMWDPVDGALDLVEPEARRLVSTRDSPIAISQRSESGEVAGEVVYAGPGSRLSDYERVEVKGRIVLARERVPAAVWAEVRKRGAAGLILAPRMSFYGRQMPRDALAWTQAPEDAIAMTISPEQADELARLIAQGKSVRVRMQVRSRRTEPGAIGQVMGEIPGSEAGKDIVVVAHLDHQHPGANDNASGSGTILEVLRALKSLIESGKLDRPRRTIRFWWATEISSVRDYFARYPEDASRILLAVNLDQAGGERDAENNFVVIYGPDWLPSWADDLIHNLAEHARERYAPAEKEPSPWVVAAGGGRQSLRVDYWNYAALSDHVSFEARGVGIPAISFAVPSLRLAHSSADTPERLDPTWMKRSALFTMASAWFAASAGPRQAREMLEYSYRRALERLAREGDAMRRIGMEEQRLDSVKALDPAVGTDLHKKRLRAIAAAMAAK